MLALVRKAEDWTQRAAAAAETERLPLKRLRDVLHAGTRMPVRFGDICSCFPPSVFLCWSCALPCGHIPLCNTPQASA